MFGQIVEGEHLENVKLENNTIRIGVTPGMGCDGRSLLSVWHPMTIDRHAESRPARVLAESVAARAGLVLANPEALDNRLVSLNFEQVPATSALQLIADIDGYRAAFNDKQVHFEPK